ncbi:MAG TPA: hypothetical protein ENF25_01255 [Thermoprotei archaeon]|nr:hypothetical protein [Euryarchaeota archaeon]MCD6158724.1 hypothetical protein [Euryarchaeota archaeon]RLF65722.1 MAG: hypothetical protein DRN26_04990 [Thermoplasmata archaeon]HDJ50813.1 hypothetical protein [Thermoprotei archaeon]
MSDVGLVLSDPIRAKIFKAICEGEDPEEVAKRARIPSLLLKREITFLVEKGLITQSEGRYVPTDKGKRVYESIDW